MTNFEKIKKMSAKQVAELIISACDDYGITLNKGGPFFDEADVRNWLLAEVEE